MKSKDQIKEDIAKEKGFDSWEAMISNIPLSGIYNEFAELYSEEKAKDAWDRAILAERKRIWDHIKQPIHTINGELYGTQFRADSLARCTNKNAPKPEYEP